MELTRHRIGEFRQCEVSEIFTQEKDGYSLAFPATYQIVDSSYGRLMMAGGEPPIQKNGTYLSHTSLKFIGEIGSSYRARNLFYLVEFPRGITVIKRLDKIEKARLLQQTCPIIRHLLKLTQTDPNLFVEVFDPRYEESLEAKFTISCDLLLRKDESIGGKIIRLGPRDP